MRTSPKLLLAAAALFAMPALAQTTATPAASATTAPATTAPAASLPAGMPSGTSPITPGDREYLAQTAQGSMYEQQISQLAADKAQNQQIKGYATMVVSDHEKFNQALQQLAQQNGVILPTSMSSQDQPRYSRLQKLSGTAFDRAYVREVRRINAQDKTQEQKEQRSTNSAAIKQFLQQFEQTDAKHYADAQKLPTRG